MKLGSLSNRRLFDVYETPNKSKLLQFVDFYNEGFYKLFHGRKFSINRNLDIKETPFNRSSLRTTINVICTLAFPLLIGTLLIKYYSKENLNRFKLVSYIVKSEAVQIIERAYKAHLFRKRLNAHIAEKNRLTFAKVFKAVSNVAKNAANNFVNNVKYMANAAKGAAQRVENAAQQFAQNHPSAYRNIKYGAQYVIAKSVEKIIKGGIISFTAAVTGTDPALLAEAVAMDKFMRENM